LLFTQEEEVDAHALRQGGWAISAIVCHPGDDRKSIRLVVTGERAVGVGVPAAWRWLEPLAPMTARPCVGGAL